MASSPDSGNVASGTSSDFGYDELTIYLPDKRGVRLKIVDGIYATANDILQIIAEEFGLPKIDTLDAMAVWVTSSSLELQLKPHMIVCEVVANWKKFLNKYGNIGGESENSEKGVVLVQRNVFYPIEMERRLLDGTLQHLLYLEAVNDFLDARYPTDSENADILGGLIARIHLGPFDRKTHFVEFYRRPVPASAKFPTQALKHVYDHMYPSHLIRARNSISSKKLVETWARDAHQAEMVKHGDNSDEECRSRFLSVCWDLPCYGSGFFAGFLKLTPMLLKNRDRRILIGVNLRGIYLIDSGRHSLILGLSHRQFSWEFRDEKCQDKISCNVPSIFIKFRTKLAIGGGKKEEEGVVNGTRLVVIHIYSRQCSLIDSLLKSTSALRFSLDSATDANNNSKDTGVDGRDDAMTSSESFINPDKKVWSNKLDRLPSFQSVQSFNEEGLEIDEPKKDPFYKTIIKSPQLSPTKKYRVNDTGMY